MRPRRISTTGQPSAPGRRVRGRGVWHVAGWCREVQRQGQAGGRQAGQEQGKASKIRGRAWRGRGRGGMELHDVGCGAGARVQWRCCGAQQRIGGQLGCGCCGKSRAGGGCGGAAVAEVYGNAAAAQHAPPRVAGTWHRQARAVRGWRAGAHAAPHDATGTARHMPPRAPTHTPKRPARRTRATASPLHHACRAC